MTSDTVSHNSRTGQLIFTHVECAHCIEKELVTHFCVSKFNLKWHSDCKVLKLRPLACNHTYHRALFDRTIQMYHCLFNVACPLKLCSTPVSGFGFSIRENFSAWGVVDLCGKQVLPLYSCPAAICRRYHSKKFRNSIRQHF